MITTNAPMMFAIPTLDVSTFKSLATITISAPPILATLKLDAKTPQ
jgi:hypothetical protein